MPDTELDFAEPLKPSLEYMKKNDINLSGDPISAMLIIANTNKGNIRYDEIWFPI